MGLSAEDQETYVLGKIEENFSNYSAWHARTSVLQQLNAERPTLSLAELLAADSKSTAAPWTPSSTGQRPQARLYACSRLAAYPLAGKASTSAVLPTCISAPSQQMDLAGFLHARDAACGLTCVK